MRPARDYDHCVQCYMALTARERALLTWEASFGPTPTAQQAARDLRFMPHAAEVLAQMAEDLAALEQITEEIDSVGLAVVVELEAWMDLPAWGERAA